VVATPATLVDVFATALDAVGAAPAPSSGRSLFAMAETPDADRIVFSEYHATGSREAMFMVQDRRYKYVRFITYPAQLFDREADPQDLRDVAADPAYATVVSRMEAALRAQLDPDEVDARAKRRQAEILAANGGWEVVMKRGDLPYSPPPGVPPNWS
jgi:choline-sulfatase